MSSISGQHKIHRHRQEVSKGSSNMLRINSDTLSANDVTAVSSPDSIDFARGVTPATAEAAVRAAPSPRISPTKCKKSSCNRNSIGFTRKYNPALEIPSQVNKRGLAPFNTFGPLPTTNTDSSTWRKSQFSSKKNQTPASITSKLDYHQVTPVYESTIIHQGMNIQIAFAPIS